MPRLSHIILVFSLTAMAVADRETLADGSAPTVPLTDASAFERTYGASFYSFDACGDSLTGQEFRAVLVDRFDQCPFSAEARMHFAEWTKAQRLKSSEVIQEMILEHGGLPVRLNGMSTTCHERFLRPDYQRLQANLEQYRRGHADTAAILHGACNALEITP
jgi:hypothetical protein